MLHPIKWVLQLARRVAKCTRTAKLHRVTDAVDNVTYFKYLTKDIYGPRTKRLITDSRSILLLGSTLKGPERARNKILLDSIREGHNRSSLRKIGLTPGQKNQLMPLQETVYMYRDNVTRYFQAEDISTTNHST